MMANGSVTSQTLVDVLRSRAERQPERLAYRFLVDGDADERPCTWARLDERARAIGAALQAVAEPGDRALLLYPPGLDYIEAFFGCLFAAVVPVPLYPPRPGRSSRGAERVRAIADDAEPALVLATSSSLPLASRGLGERPVRCVATDAIERDAAERWQRPALTGGDLAFLQYTSGSTAAPKGVIVTHANLLHNCVLMQRCFALDETSHSVIWLPPYHDMGLIGGIIAPLCVGFSATLMSPMHFLQRPARWLQAVSRHRATTSGGPNFAYELCIRRITAEERAPLDLSSWGVAFNGAEPVRADTLRRFAETFVPQGFRSEAMCPCYGLAEATLLVAGSAAGVPPTLRAFRSISSEGSRGAFAPDDEGRVLVGCGSSPGDQRIVVVDPDRREPCRPGDIGEIWVQGPSVAQGYWRKSDETARTFHASLPGGGDPFLRTGDLGFLDGDDLFVTGRLKDLVIIRGRNHYPHDIELTVEGSTGVLRPGCGAAFSVTVDGDERLVVVHEVERDCRAVDVDETTDLIRRAVVDVHDVYPYAVVLLQPGTLPKTSSGKVRRHACREAFLAGTLDAVETRVRPDRRGSGDAGDAAAPAPAAAPTADPASIGRYLQELVARRLEIDVSRLDPAQPLVALGVDSLMAVELQGDLETTFRRRLPVRTLLGDVSLDELTAAIAAAPALDEAPGPAPAPDPPADLGPQPLSHGQRALWFLHQVAPTERAYNIASAMRVRGLDPEALRKALARLVERHPLLRARFVARNGEPWQEILPDVPVPLRVEEAGPCADDVLLGRMNRIAREPFDLEDAPLFRVHLFCRAEGEQVLLFVVHHIVVDFWSLVVLARDLGELYRAEREGAPARLPHLAAGYGEYVRRQEEMLKGPNGARLWTYWQGRLAGELPVLDMPLDRPRPAVQTDNGGAEWLHLDHELTGALEALSRAQGATLFVTLLAAFQVLLGRYTGSADVLVGAPVSRRDAAALRDVVGYFVNPLVLRGDLSANPPFLRFLRQARERVADALEHQALPFPVLAQHLQPVRDPSRSPVFQAAFIFHRAPFGRGEDVALFAVGEAGASLSFGDVTLESMRFTQPGVQFDLTLAVAVAAGSLRASLQYNADLFAPEAIRRLLASFETLLRSVVAGPERRIDALELVPAPERHELLVARNDTAAPETPGDGLCVHEMIEQTARGSPTATALVVNDVAITYDELNRRANRLASRLIRAGAGPDVRVGLYMERSPDLLVGLLGILKAGSAYVPLDPTYPPGRLSVMLTDSGARVLVTRRGLGTLFAGRLDPRSVQTVYVEDGGTGETADDEDPATAVTPDHLAYVIYTSGSTGTPKGVMVRHRSVVNFFAAMDAAVGCDARDTLLAVTSVSFDISVLELLWPLARGARVVLLPETALTWVAPPRRARARKPIDFSVFFFASDSAHSPESKYRLVIEGARFADRHGFSAVWTPERHFHEFGGLYPSPAVLGAMLAGITERLHIRAGSVVLPLHDPIRVAEEWALVDNLSNGRAGVAFASGWHADDFVFFPENYGSRKEIMFRGIETVQRLWRGEAIAVRGGAGNEIAVRTLPRPVQPRLPVWITAAGATDTFARAGQLGAGVLTHLLGQTIDDVARKIEVYRAALHAHGHGPEAGHVVLMLHTFLADDRRAAREIVREPFTAYLRSSVGLIGNLITSLNLPLDLRAMSPADMDALLAFAFDRYFETSALFGTPASCAPLVERLEEIGVDEIACLLDFGIDTDRALESLARVSALKDRACDAPAADYSLQAQARRFGATLVQCTPSLMRMLALAPGTFDALQSVRAVLLGGEPLPAGLAQQVKEHLPGRLLNMYGPTETTIWSAVHEVGAVGATIPLGRPIRNTQIHVLDRHLRLVPTGVVGELCVGGAGLARGYLGRPGLTAERFVPDPFGSEPGARLYRTGDLVRIRADGELEFIGRTDQQVKLRGFRIELPEIEVVLGRHESVREAVAVVRREDSGDERVVAYVVPRDGAAIDVQALKDHAGTHLPAYMVPASIVPVQAFPVTANGKIDRKRLPRPEQARIVGGGRVAPRNTLEQTILGIWQELLATRQIGVHDNFFDLGGHSLLMAQVHSRLRSALGREIPLVKLLEHPTVASLAGYLSLPETGRPSFSQSVERARRQLASRRRVGRGAGGPAPAPADT